MILIANCANARHATCVSAIRTSRVTRRKQCARDGALSTSGDNIVSIASAKAVTSAQTVFHAAATTPRIHKLKNASHSVIKCSLRTTASFANAKDARSATRLKTTLQSRRTPPIHLVHLRSRHTCLGLHHRHRGLCVPQSRRASSRRPQRAVGRSRLPGQLLMTRAFQSQLTRYCSNFLRAKKLLPSKPTTASRRQRLQDYCHPQATSCVSAQNQKEDGGYYHHQSVLAQLNHCNNRQNRLLLPYWCPRAAPQSRLPRLHFVRVVQAIPGIPSSGAPDCTCHPVEATTWDGFRGSETHKVWVLKQSTTWTGVNVSLLTD
mmetsp:Transcript_19865/g.45633  ORF Transcript_19865/g.45633 Transcript_19865/m.45633 type:complete len:319 (-) Transcript_19865:1579-2535(-)